MTCQTIGCVEAAVWMVADARRERKVCGDCRDHLVVTGWHPVGRESA